MELQRSEEQFSLLHMPHPPPAQWALQPSMQLPQLQTLKPWLHSSWAFAFFPAKFGVASMDQAWWLADAHGHGLLRSLAGRHGVEYRSAHLGSALRMVEVVHFVGPAFRTFLVSGLFGGSCGEGSREEGSGRIRKVEGLL